MKILLIGIGVLAAAVACGGAPDAVAPLRAAPALVLVTVAAPAPQRATVLRRSGGVPSERLSERLSMTCVSAWSPCVSHDATRLCFLGREAATAPVRLYTSGPDGGDAVAVVAEVDEESAPAWLPDGRVVYAAPAPDGSRALFTLLPPAGTPRRITFCGTHAGDPTVLVDGRILYVGRVLDGGDEESRPALFTVHPDGSGASLLHARTRATDYARPRQSPDGTIAFLTVGEPPAVCTLDWRAPHEESVALSLPAPPVAIEPLADGSWACLVRPAGGGPAQLLRVAPDGEVSTLRTDVSTDASTAPSTALSTALSTEVAGLCSAAVRPRPQGHLSMVREGTPHGQLLCLDARSFDGAQRPAGPAAGLAQTARLHARNGRTAGADWRELGDTALEADGSFFVRVPADVPLRLELLDAEGAVVSASRTPFWVRPSEVRGCIGCHTPPDATPPNRMPQAALGEPLDLSAALHTSPPAGKGAAR